MWSLDELMRCEAEHVRTGPGSMSGRPRLSMSPSVVAGACSIQAWPSIAHPTERSDISRRLGPRRGDQQEQDHLCEVGNSAL